MLNKLLSLIFGGAAPIKAPPEPGMSSPSQPSPWAPLRGGEPLLFLDFDGVLHRGENGSFERMPHLAALLAARPDLRVVISSSWRLNTSADYLLGLFPPDVRDKIVGVTPDLGHAGGDREQECLAFAAKVNAWAFVALDDDASLYGSDCRFLVLTDRYEGLTEAEAERCLSLLSGYGERSRTMPPSQRHALQLGRDQAIDHVRRYHFPTAVHTHLAKYLMSKGFDDIDGRVDLALQGLRDYFVLHVLEQGSGRQLGMPSVLVDEAWHAFLECAEYREFCLIICGAVIEHREDPGVKPRRMSPTDRFKADVKSTAAACRRAMAQGYIGSHGLTAMPVLFAADMFAGIGGWGWDSDAYAAASGEVSRKSASASSSTGASCAAVTTGFDSATTCDASSSSSCDSGSSCSSGSSCGGGCGGG